MPISRDPRGKPAVRATEPAAPRTGADGLLDDLLTFRRGLLTMRHATYHSVVGVLIKLLSGPSPDARLLGAFERAWRTRSFSSFYERPLLILAALRFDALEEGAEHPLHAALGAAIPDAASVTQAAVESALAAGRLGVWSALGTRRVQTDDTTRALVWLWPAFLAGCDEGARPLALVDIGASAGLNLVGAGLPAALTARVRGGHGLQTLVLARSGQHPTELEVDEANAAQLKRALSLGY